ncbi:MAG TPA: hypothetical protein VFC55_04595, partial [Desulfobaccales bacterium]|nr:hypothetical protein [Desulfobaccales bacterium]
PLLPQVSSETPGWYHSPGQPYHIYPREAKYFPWLAPGDLIPDCSQGVAQAFQPVQAQAKACGYKKLPFERNSVLIPH